MRNMISEDNFNPDQIGIGTYAKRMVPILVYMLIYLLWFHYLENRSIQIEYLIHTPLDDKIPFCKYFIIPYLFWCGYVAVASLYFLFADYESFRRLYLFLVTGMTLFLLISTLWPNGHDLRPVITGSGVCDRLVQNLYNRDTSTNLWPSIHTYNSLGVWYAVKNAEHLKKKKGIRILFMLISYSIVASTVLLKQHSVFDVISAFLFAGTMYYFTYVLDLLDLIGQRRPRAA